MNVFTRDNLKILAETHKGLCVSIFMSMHRSGPETQQDPIRFKNLLREAEERLIAHGLRVQEAKELLEPTQRLIEGSLFREHQSDGLAVFLSRGALDSYLVPLAFEELVVVANRFHIKPLLPLLSGDGRYYILALSQNEVRLLQGTHYSLTEVDLGSTPQNLAETLRDDDSRKEHRFRTSTSGGKSKRAVIGYGNVVDDKENLRRYFRQIDGGLHEMLRNERAPLVLAVVDYLHPIYREVNTYPHLMNEGVSGNPDRLNAEELHQQAWTVVKPHFQRIQQEAVDQYKQCAGSLQASNDVTEIIPAAYHGRVELLFVVADLQQWGTFDPDTDAIHLHQKEEAGDEDLSEFAALQTLLNGGTVYVVESERMPDDTSFAAVFRY
jgi:hypothetical protein